MPSYAGAPLAQSATVQLTGAGNGTASLGPLSAREVWHPGSVHVSVATANTDATCQIYVGSSVAANTFRDATFTGSSGDSSDRVSSDVVKVGSKVWAVWTGGDPLATATLTVTGTKDV